MDTSHTPSLFRSTVENEPSEASERRNLPPETVLEDYFNTPDTSSSSPTRVLQDEAPELFTPPVETVEDYSLPEVLQPSSVYSSVTSYVLQEYMADATSVPSSHGIRIAVSPPPRLHPAPLALIPHAVHHAVLAPLPPHQRAARRRRPLPQQQRQLHPDDAPGVLVGGATGRPARTQLRRRRRRDQRCRCLLRLSGNSGGLGIGGLVLGS